MAFYSEFDPIIASPSGEEQRQAILAASGATEVQTSGGQVVATRTVLPERQAVAVGDVGNWGTKAWGEMAEGVGLGAGAGIIGPMAGAVPTVTSAIGGLIPAGAGGVLGTLGSLAAAGGLIYGGLQALGLGEGGGLFGINLLGGDDFTMGGLEFGGPGLSEPGQGDYRLVNEWRSGNKQFYYLVPRVATDKRRPKGAMYDRVTKRWKVWSWPRPRLAVIGKNMPKHRQIVRLRKNLSKHRADADTILSLTSPKYQGYKARRRGRRR